MSKTVQFPSESSVLLAFSGGIDSVVLAHLLIQNGYKPALAHVNYGLRGMESDGDEQFCKNFATAHALQLHVIKAPIRTNDVKSSVQTAAREFRYKWFDELCAQHSYRTVCTAHHLDDSIETFLINLSRGTGIRGLTGIPRSAGFVLRPLLQWTREDIHSYALDNQLEWREDSSNATDEYLRNRIRNHLVPEFTLIRPDIRNSFSKTIQQLNEANGFLQFALSDMMGKYTRLEGKAQIIRLEELSMMPYAEFILYEWLSVLGYSRDVCKEILRTKRTGAVFASGSHRASVRGNELVIVPEIRQPETFFFTIDKPEGSALWMDGSIEWHELNPTDAALLPIDKYRALLNIEYLGYPLFVDIRREGDRMRPAGFSGTRKLSDVLTDSKIPQVERDFLPVVRSAGEIVWVGGLRLGEKGVVNVDCGKVLVVFWRRS
jgi:tRNA(Ile)-lysidine synthase